MKPILWILLAGLTAGLLILAGCKAHILDGPGMEGKSYTQIDQDTARQMMEKNDGHVVVDVRRQDEYDAGHIPGAILIPNESITDTPPAELPDKDQIILIYCRSGNRSKEAARKLFDMGYTKVYEFGGINSWPGETETAALTEPTLDREGAVLRFSSFDGGGPEYELTAEDPSLITWTAKREYGSDHHELETGSSYEMVYTIRGAKPGTTGVTVLGSSPIIEPISRKYVVTVDEALNVAVTPVRTLSRLFAYRNGSINYDSYTITPEEDGYLLTVNEEQTRRISRETADAVYAVYDKYGMEKWDGFHKSHSGVLDGEGFALEIALTDGTIIRASGDNAFPENYFDAMYELWTILTTAAQEPDTEEPAP